MFVLDVTTEDQPVLSMPLSGRPIHIGRACFNDLVVDDPEVSEYHALVWPVEGVAWARDLGSSNGTFVNEERLVGRLALKDGDRIQVGTRAIRLRTMQGVLGSRPIFLLEDQRTSLSVPLVRDRFHVGSAPDCDMVISSLPAVAFMMKRDGQSLQRVSEGGEQEVILDVPFTTADRTFIVRDASDRFHPTIISTDTDRTPRYRVSARMASVVGATVTITNLDTGASHTIDAENRAILLSQLARATCDDQANDLEPTLVGWRDDYDLRIAIWGRSAKKNQLNVLLHRIRRELWGSDIDPRFIEKARGRTRINVIDVEIG